MSVDLVMEDARWKTLDLPQIANTAFKETLSQVNMRSENFICCILACSSKKIRGLNLQFRGKNISTNVLSFPSKLDLCEIGSSSKFEADIDPFELGDIAIAYADTSKIYNLLNWKTSKSIEDMCKDGWNWQKKLISVQKLI